MEDYNILLMMNIKNGRRELISDNSSWEENYFLQFSLKDKKYPYDYVLVYKDENLIF